MAEQLTRKSVAAGSWLIGHNFVARISGLAKTAIIARLLTPKHFGQFGVIALTLSLLETFTETGIEQALIQKTNVSEKDLSAARVINLARGLIISSALFLAAPLIEIFFHQQNIALFIKVMALAPLIRGFINPRAVLFQKKLEFNKVFLLRLSGTLAELLVGVFVSLQTRNVWGLVAALIAGAMVEVFTSHILIKPVWSFRYSPEITKELLSFGRWLWGSSILSYLANQGDDVVVGRLLGASALGFYQNAYKIASLPATQITGVVSQVTYPAFSQIKKDKVRLGRAFKKAFLTTLAVTVPLSLVIILFAHPLTKIILGIQWLEIVPALKVLGIFGLIRAASSPIGALFKAVGKPEIVTQYGILRVIVMTLTIVPLSAKWGIVGTSWSIVISILLTQPYFLIKLKDVFQ